MSRITGLRVLDVRFPTSRELDGSDAMNPDPDYSAAYVVIAHRRRRRPRGPRLRLHDRPRQRRPGRRHRRAAPSTSSGATSTALLADLGGFWRALVHDSQLRWLGPEKGVDAHGDRRRGERALGPARQARRAAAVAAAGAT